MINGNNAYSRPPPPLAPSLVPPYRDSVFNMVVRRIRAANTIFGDRVKLTLRQDDREHWSSLKRPYLLVVMSQTRSPRNLDIDPPMSFINPRDITLVAQFDDQGSEASYLAANDIDTAEAQLIYVLANWEPTSDYKPTLYGGMHIQGTRAPDVKVNFLFTLQEWQSIGDVSFNGEDIDEPMQIQTQIHINDPCCNLPCEIIPPLTAEWLVTGGGCGCMPPLDPCAPDRDPCSPLFGGPNEGVEP